MYATNETCQTTGRKLASAAAILKIRTVVPDAHTVTVDGPYVRFVMDDEHGPIECAVVSSVLACADDNGMIGDLSLLDMMEINE